MQVRRRTVIAASIGAATTGIAGCLGSEDDTDETAETVGTTLTLSTTTSTYDTGLLDDLNAGFESRFGVSVDTISQGTGAAIETGRAGDADVVMVHARSLEDEFIADGDGVNRRDLMFNDFVVLGDPDDPADIASVEEVEAGFEAIAEEEATFVSRGDDSGTHTKELDIWEEAGTDPGGDWYQEAGQGMGEVLTQADQQGGYTLADRGTYLSMRSEIDLEILLEGPIEGGPELLANPYGIVAVDQSVHDGVEYDLAMAYIGFVTSLDGQEIIESYTVDDEQLFFPDALSEDPNFEQYVPEDWT